MGCHFLLQGIFPTQGSNPGIPHCRQTLYCLSHQGIATDDYTVEVTNRFKGLDLIDRVPEELWKEVHELVQEIGIKTIPNKKKGKMVV